MTNWTPKRIKEFRKTHKLTRKQLGSLLGVTDRSIYYWERRLRTPSKSLMLLLDCVEEKLKKKER